MVFPEGVVKVAEVEDSHGAKTIAVDVGAEAQARVLFGYYDDILDRFRHEGAALGRWKKITKSVASGGARYE